MPARRTGVPLDKVRAADAVSADGGGTGGWSAFEITRAAPRRAEFAKMAFEAQLPLFWCPRRVNDDPTVISIETRGLDEQVMTHTVGAGTPNYRATTIPMRMDQITVSDPP